MHVRTRYTGTMTAGSRHTDRWNAIQYSTPMAVERNARMVCTRPATRLTRCATREEREMATGTQQYSRLTATGRSPTCSDRRQ